MRRFALLAGCVGLVVWWFGRSPDVLKVGAFNIENFPRSEQQIAAAFSELAALELDVVALQEITEPEVAARAAARYLGRSWRAAFCRRCPTHKIGVLYDAGRLELLGTRDYPEVVRYPGGRPAFEARFAIGGGAPLRVIAVHLKAGGDGAEIRERQLEALRPIVAAAVESGDRVVLAGDFNATSDNDRANIAELAQATRMTWASRGLECTCFWQRAESCFGAALDHMLASFSPAAVDVAGACADECQPGRRCPTYKQEVSDHCPVWLELP